MKKGRKKWIVLGVVGTLVIGIGVAAGVCVYHFVGIPTCVGDTSYGIEIREVHTQAKDIDIFGKTIVPKGEKDQKYPTVIYAHGAESDYNADMTTLKSLAKSGLACYTFDFYGWTNRTKGPKPGAWFKGYPRGVDNAYPEKVLEQVDELNAVIENVKTFSFVDLDRIYLLGSSMGGATVATCAPFHSEDIHSIVLQYPAINLNLNAYNPASEYEVTKYTNNVLILQGDNDKIVPLSMGEELYSYYNHEEKKAKMIVYPGQPHVFTGKYKVQAARDIYRFLITEGK